MNKKQIHERINEIQSELKDLKAKLAEPEVGALGFKKAVEGDRHYCVSYLTTFGMYYPDCSTRGEKLLAFNQTYEGASLLAKKLNVIAKLAIQGRDYVRGRENLTIDGGGAEMHTLPLGGIQVYFPTLAAAQAAWNTLTKEEQEAYKA
jgi:hypothetical protein